VRSPPDLEMVELFSSQRLFRFSNLGGSVRLLPASPGSGACIVVVLFALVA
jgi:hypothetical protein